MSKERELLKKALHVLTSSKVWGGKEYTYLPIHPCQYKGISAEIKELLAQPEQEPVAWRYKTHNRYTYTEENYHELEGKPLYTKPPKREIEQEPVAWMYDWNIIEEEEYGETRYDNLTRAESITKSRAITNVRPLYTHPPKQYLLDDREKFRMVLELVKKLYMPKVFG